MIEEYENEHPYQPIIPVLFLNHLLDLLSKELIQCLQPNLPLKDEKESETVTHKPKIY